MIVFGLILPITTAWVLITQPIWASVEAGHKQIDVDTVRLKTHVKMLSETLPARDWSHPENLDKAAAYIRQEFEKTNGAVSEQVYKADGKTYRNVIACFGPNTKDRIVVGAHYDVEGGKPGADDNASGVAGLIELAHMFGKVPPSRRVELVAYSLEEPPYFATQDMGSYVHAFSLKKKNIHVRLMIALEMIGCFTDKPGSQGYPALLLKMFYPSRGNFIAVVGKFGQGDMIKTVKNAMQDASDLPVYSIRSPLFVPGIDYSDHRNYWEAGYNAVMVTDTSFYRNNRYHTKEDTADTLDYNRMANVVQGVYEAVNKVME